MNCGIENHPANCNCQLTKVMFEQMEADQSLKRELVEALKAHHVCFNSEHVDCRNCAIITRAEATL